MRIECVLIVAIVSVAGVALPTENVWAVAMRAEECALETQKAGLWISGGGGATRAALPKVASAFAETGLAASAQLATKAGPVVSAVTIGAEGGTLFGSLAWRISQGFWTLLGKKDPTPSMPDPFQPTTLRVVDLNTIYSLAGIDPAAVAEVAPLFPIVQTTFNLIGDTVKYDVALEAFTTAYTKFLEADLLGDSSLAHQHAADMLTFTPLLQAAADQLVLDGAAQQAAWDQFWNLFTSLTGLPIEFTADVALAFQKDIATNGFPDNEVAIMKLLGASDDDIKSLAEDSLAISPTNLASLNFADQIVVCKECQDRLLKAIPWPDALSLMLIGLVIVRSAVAFERRRLKR